MVAMLTRNAKASCHMSRSKTVLSKTAFALRRAVIGGKEGGLMKEAFGASIRMPTPPQGWHLECQAGCPLTGGQEGRRAGTSNVAAHLLRIVASANAARRQL